MMAKTGSQKPTVAVIPDYKETDGALCAELSKAYGLDPDPWQRLVIDAFGGRDAGGRYAATRCGLSVPRQNGKNAILEMLELFGIAVLGKKFLHTAHEVKTARKSFVRLCQFFEDERRYPELARLVDAIRKTNGQEAVVLKNGGSVEFSARSKGAARGYTVDCVVFDEAQELTNAQLEAIMPTMAAAPSGDRQMILTGTPPYPGCIGDVFRRMRESAIAGKAERVCWVEWSVSDVGDVSDRARWRETNPALGIRLTESFVEDECGSLSAEGFARERLGWWSPESAIETYLTSDEWGACYEPEPDTKGRRVYAMRFSADGRFCSFAVCVAAEGKKPHVEVVDAFGMERGMPFAVEMLKRRIESASAFWLDGNLAQQAADSLIEAGARRRDVHVVRAHEAAEACDGFVRAVRDREVTHFRDKELARSATMSSKRRIGASGHGFESNEKAEAALVESCALAWLGTMKERVTKKRKTTGVAF